MSDEGINFINRTVRALTEEFQVQHKKSTPYHMQANKTAEVFNKIFETVLTKVCNTNRNDWDLKIPVVLWAYRTTCKWLKRETPFKLVYGQEAVMPMEYIVLSFHIAVETEMDDAEALEESIAQLIHLEEDRFIAGFNQRVAKDRQKAQHDRHIKHKQFVEGDLLLLYNSKFMKHLGKLQMHWLGPYLVHSITSMVQFNYSNQILWCFQNL